MARIFQKDNLEVYSDDKDDSLWFEQNGESSKLTLEDFKDLGAAVLKYMRERKSKKVFDNKNYPMCPHCGFRHGSLSGCMG